MAKTKKLRKNATRTQKVVYYTERKEWGLLPYERWGTPCPKRGGPSNPNSEHPGEIGPAGDDGWGTCNGCKYYQGHWFTCIVCSHSKAAQVAGEVLARDIKRWKEERASQPALL